jgi:hypothetical protein
MNGDRWIQLLIAGFGAAALLSGVRVLRAPRSRTRARAAVFAMSFVGLGLLLWARFIEPYWIETTTTHVPWKGPPLRVVLLADLHAGRTVREQVRETVERTNAANPDVVVIAGDFVTGYEADPEKLAILDELRALAPRTGTFAVLGNHDTEPAISDEPRADAITRHLEGLGVVVLRNAWRTVVPGVTIVGLGDYDAQDGNGAKAFMNAPEGAILLVAHNPASVKHTSAGRFDVALAAHTHGGQACVPFVRYCPFVHPEALPYVAGLYSLPGGGSLYVTRGIGESTLKARFACRPEISILDLSP